MAVAGVGREPVSAANSLIGGKIQGNTRFLASVTTLSPGFPEGFQLVSDEFPTETIKEFSQTNREAQERNRELMLPAPHLRASWVNFAAVAQMR